MPSLNGLFKKGLLFLERKSSWRIRTNAIESARKTGRWKGMYMEANEGKLRRDEGRYGENKGLSSVRMSIVRERKARLSLSKHYGWEIHTWLKSSMLRPFAWRLQLGSLNVYPDFMTRKRTRIGRSVPGSSRTYWIAFNWPIGSEIMNTLLHFLVLLLYLLISQVFDSIDFHSFVQKL